jgi:hypothetical protein
VTELRSSLGADGVRLTWTETPYGRLVLLRTVDPGSGVATPPRRAVVAGGSYLDQDVLPGVTYRYTLLLERTGPGGRVKTGPLAETVVRRLPERPRAVLDAEVDQTGVLRWTAPGAEVAVYAGDAPLAAEGTELTLSDLTGRARLVGVSRRGRLRDTPPPTVTVVYTPVTIAGEVGVAGRAVTRPPTAVPPPAGSAVPPAPRVPPPGAEPSLPTGPASPPGPSAVPLPARSVTRVTYGLRRSGWRRRTLRVEVRADGPVPDLVLLARTGSIPPTGTGDGAELGRLPASTDAGSQRALEVTLQGAQLPWAVRLLPAADQPGAQIVVSQPPDDQLVVS